MAFMESGGGRMAEGKPPAKRRNKTTANQRQIRDAHGLNLANGILMRPNLATLSLSTKPIRGWQ
jgi:hypothetical protein